MKKRVKAEWVIIMGNAEQRGQTQLTRKEIEAATGCTTDEFETWRRHGLLASPLSLPVSALPHRKRRKQYRQPATGSGLHGPRVVYPSDTVDRIRIIQETRAYGLDLRAAAYELFMEGRPPVDAERLREVLLDYLDGLEETLFRWQRERGEVGKHGERSITRYVHAHAAEVGLTNTQEEFMRTEMRMMREQVAIRRASVKAANIAQLRQAVKEAAGELRKSGRSDWDGIIRQQFGENRDIAVRVLLVGHTCMHKHSPISIMLPFTTIEKLMSLRAPTPRRQALLAEAVQYPMRIKMYDSEYQESLQNLSPFITRGLAQMRESAQ